jgi:hypothetical protein
MPMKTSSMSLAAHTSIMRTTPPQVVMRDALASRRGHAAGAAPPTTSVSVVANRSWKGASATRANCNEAMARPPPQPLVRHGTRVRAPPRRDLTLGRAPATPAEAGSPTIPRPERSPLENPQRHADAARGQLQSSTPPAATAVAAMHPPPDTSSASSSGSRWQGRQLSYPPSARLAAPPPQQNKRSSACWPRHSPARSRPTTTESGYANRRREASSASRGICVAAVASMHGEASAQHSTRLLALMDRQPAVGRALPTPTTAAAAVGSEKIPRPKPTHCGQ